MTGVMVRVLTIAILPCHPLAYPGVGAPREESDVVNAMPCITPPTHTHITIHADLEVLPGRSKQNLQGKALRIRVPPLQGRHATNIYTTFWYFGQD